ncbi:MAG: hypothetical protein P0116_15335 [Candidatus Nitrosocosmicus sp.]|nr:hypothetical protein [Candidatus Nitrosocosmicus sp.]
MNKYSFVFLAVITTALLSTGSVVTNAFSSTQVAYHIVHQSA